MSEKVGVHEVPLGMELVPIDDLSRTARQWLVVVKGFSSDDAEAMDENMMTAQLCGGSKLPQAYAIKMPGMEVDPAATEVSVVNVASGLEVYDGGRRPGMYVAKLATRRVIEMVKAELPHAMVVVSNEHVNLNAASTGSLRSYAEMMGAAGLVGKFISIPQVPLVAGPDSANRLLGPIAVGTVIPVGNGEMIISDMTKASTPFFTAKQFQAEGRKFTENVLIDENGYPTNDPAVLDRGGAIVAAGGMKGFAEMTFLQMMAEMFRVSLSERAWIHMAEVWNPAVFGDPELVRQRAASWAEKIRQSTPREGVDQVRMPGDRATAEKAKWIDAGVVPIKRGFVDQLKAEIAVVSG